MRMHTQQLHQHAFAMPRLTTPLRQHRNMVCRSQQKSVDQLRDPVRIGTRTSKQATVKEVPGYPLDTYMRLPVEQYYELDPNMIKPLGNSRFQLLVPRIQLFNVWLEPVVEVHVQQQGEQVVIEAVQCQLKGSDLIANMQLDRKFVLNFRTVLTWGSTGPTTELPTHNGANGATNSAAHGANGNANGAAAAAAAASVLLGTKPAVTAKGAKGAPEGAPAQGTIYADLDLNVWCEVIPPFNMLPRESVLQPTVNAVLAGLVRTLLPVFVRKLGSDYERWAKDDSYRKRRAALTQAAVQAAAAHVSVAAAPAEQVVSR